MELKFNGKGTYKGNGLSLYEGKATLVEVTEELGEYLLKDYWELFDATKKKQEAKKER